MFLAKEEGGVTAKAFRLLSLTLFIAFASYSAVACDCERLTAHDRYHHADVVFVGTAVSKTFFGGGVRFHVDESFWGTSGDSIVIKQYDPIICDSFAFKVGKKYLVAAYKEGDQLTAGACNQGVGIGFATGDIHVLRGQREGKPIPQVYGTIATIDGTPLAHARVALQNEKGDEFAKTIAGVDGYFEFNRVPQGAYMVVAIPESGGPAIKQYFSPRATGNRLFVHKW